MAIRKIKPSGRRTAPIVEPAPLPVVVAGEVAKAKITQLIPDGRNANAGTARGGSMIERSLREYGAGRSVLVDKHGVLIAGNKTVEAAVSAGINDVVLVPTDGKTLVVVQRTDLDISTDVRAKELGIADNRAGEVSLKWDADVLLELQEQSVEMEKFFRDTEWDSLIETSTNDEGEEIPEMTLQPFEQYNYLMVVFRDTQDWDGVCDILSIRTEGVTLGEIRKIGLGRVIEGKRLLEAIKK